MSEPIGPRDNESLSERLTRITAQRNRYWEQVEVLTGVLRRARAAAQIRSDLNERMHGRPTRESWVQDADAALAAVAEESEK